MQKIEAIVFDLGGVILNIDYNLTRNAFEKLGVLHFDELYSQVKANKLFRSLETGNINEEDFYSDFNKCTCLSLTPYEIQKAWNAMLLTFRESSLKFLEQIKSSYRLFLLSNTNTIHYDKFIEIYYENERSFTFESFFERAYYSFQLGMRKPDYNIYEFVLEKSNLKSENTLFIDDSIQNIDAANSLGFQTIFLEKDVYIENLRL